MLGQAVAAPLPPSGSVIGDSRIYSGPRRYGWRRHAYPEPPPAAAQSALGQQGWTARLGRWRGWRQASQGERAQAAAGDPEENSGDVSAGQSPPVVAVPALVDGVPSDGASDSRAGGGGNAGVSLTDLEAGDVQLMRWRTAAAEGSASTDTVPGAASAAPHHRQMHRPHLQRGTSEAGAAGPGSGVRIGQDVSVGQNVHIGIDVSEAHSGVEAPRERAG